MSTEFIPVPAFNCQLQFDIAYTWTKAQVLDFLSKVAANPATYGAPANRQADFQQIYGYISALVEGGASYVAPVPAQQILRKAQQPPALNPTASIPWTVNTIGQAYFIIFDLLGVFLSLMGPAPTTTGTAPTSKNYFLPLAVVYARWCGQLAKSKAFTPTVVQVTWSSKDSGKTWYPFLGSSAAGFVKDPAWKDLVGKTRHDYLSGVLSTSSWPAYGQSFLRDADSKAGTNFGNCGETYPFLYILADSTLKTSSYGIALKVAKLTESTYNGANYWSLGAMLPPCGNCTQLLGLYGVGNRLPNFQLYTT